MDKVKKSAFEDDHLYTGHYTGTCVRSCLEKIKLRDYYSDLSSEYLEECPYDDASVFLHGSCDLFTWKLHKKYGYERYKAVDKNGNLIHSFGKSTYQGKEVYIDVRGATTNFDRFFSEFKTSSCEEVHFCKDMEIPCNGHEYYDIGLRFAQDIIRNYSTYYEL